MRRYFLGLLFLSMLFVTGCPQAGHAQTFDADGGWQQSPCAGGAKGYFYTEKVGNHWWLCTPEGNHFHANALSAMEVPGSNASTNWASGVLAKYGGSTNTAALDTLNKFVNTYHFNVVAEDSNAMYYPWSGTHCTGCALIPGFQSSNLSVYALVNLNGYAPHAVKNYIIGVDGYFKAYNGAGCTDYFDPAYKTYAQGYWPAQSTYGAGTAHIVGYAVDDTDFLCGLGASDNFDTFPTGHSKANVAYIALTTSPIETLNPGNSYSNTIELFTDTKVYSKDLSTTPPTSLSQCWSLSDTTKPACSLEDYLYAEYGGSISALDTAWGGATYTSWNSTGTTISSFPCGTGNGTQLVFTCTLPVTGGNISPLSVAVYEGTTMIAGDCAWFEAGNKCPVLTNPPLPYNCATAGSCEGVVEGLSTGPLQSGIQVWNSNNPCGALGANSSAPHASFAAVIMWHGSGSYLASRQTGNNCAATEGDYELSPVSPPSGVTGYDVYMSCKLYDSATPAFGCVGNGATQPAPTLQATNVAVGTNWTVPSTGLVTGAAIPPPQSFLDYGTGAVTLTFASGSAPSSGTAITINAVAGGWMWGTGLADEDGRSSWLDGGANAICMTYAGGTVDGSAGYSCRPGNAGGNPTTFVNATAGADLNNWNYQAGAMYFGTVATTEKAAYPHMLYFGANVLGDWGAPGRQQLLQAAGVYVDVLFSDSVHQGEIPDEATRRAFAEQYFGDKPMAEEEFLSAPGDSAIAYCAICYGQASFSSQSARGTEFYNRQNNCLNSTGYNGDTQCVFIDWWGSADFNASEKNNWGLTTPNDNDYNGIEPAVSSVACVVDSALTCGSEPAPGPDYTVSLAYPALQVLTPLTNNAGDFNFQLTNGPCTSGSTYPASWNQVPNGTTTDANGCIWQNISARPYGNALTGPTGVIAANQLWYQAVIRPTAASKKSIAYAQPSDLTKTAPNPAKR
jgi:hypothetical protein